MYDRIHHDGATSNILAWTSHSANVEPSAEEEAGLDADEPPDHRFPRSPLAAHFKRGPIRRGSEHHESLLTKALQSQSDEEASEASVRTESKRRRSITSNVSLASTTQLTCETGITTPARTSSPSPRLPDVGFVPLPAKAPRVLSAAATSPSGLSPGSSAQSSKDPAVHALEKKRCISFACAAKPRSDVQQETPAQPSAPAAPVAKPAAQVPAKKSCIKFACPFQPSNKALGTALPKEAAVAPAANRTPESLKIVSLKQRSPSTARTLRSLTPRRSGQSPSASRPKQYLDANLKDLQSEGSRFHEFATDEPQMDDWIRRDENYVRCKLTIKDTLEKENAIRKLGKEAEEEADLELEAELDDEEEGAANSDDDDLTKDEVEEDEEEVDEGEPDLDDGYSGYGSDDDASDGYNTDNEVGFADSDDEDDDLVLWTTHEIGQLSISGATPVRRQEAAGAIHSDSSDGIARRATTHRPKKTKPIVFRPGTPELPDSTDFVCGTLDEDRPLEDAYISCMAARRREKQVIVPQDIDPSFPNSEPEDEAEEYYQGQGDSDDQVWVHGEIEDINHEQDRAGRRGKNVNQSPKRYRSPPPTKRHHSPAPKARGRSPRRLLGHYSPKRQKSPAPAAAAALRSPAASLAETGRGIAFRSLAFAPGLTYTKSLPKPPTIFAQPKGRKRTGTVAKGNAPTHVRGAIDIVKGLEQKRLRRKEKFYQKYCNNRARKEKAQEKRLPPGQGAERMREIGLGQAKTHGNYVLSC